MKRPIADREQIVSAFVKKEIGKDTAASLLGCTKRTFQTYVAAYLAFGVSGLIDHRSSNRRILSASQIDAVITLKRTQEWRSSRNIRDYLELPVHARTIWKVLIARGLA